MTKWADRIPRLRELAGTMPAADVATELGCTLNSTRYYASVYGISLVYPATEASKAKNSMASGHKAPTAPKPKTKPAKKTKVKPAPKAQKPTPPPPAAKPTPPPAKVPPPEKAKKPAPPSNTHVDFAERALDAKLENASRFLRSHGYTVFLPCPFRRFVDPQRSGSSRRP
tara:strand:- start:22021 stop:22530 length:510 start_codon:yes stop_codon:yes gene_type:complete